MSTEKMNTIRPDNNCNYTNKSFVNKIQNVKSCNFVSKISKYDTKNTINFYAFCRYIVKHDYV